MRIWAGIKWAFGWPSRFVRWLLQPVDALVLGSAHIDTVGEVENADSFTRGSDHEGRIVYSVGGSGYNVAVNLAAAGKNPRVALNTLLPKDSRLADLVTAKLVQNGVSLAYVRRVSMRREHAQDFVETAMGGYVAIRARDDTVSSVSRSLVSTPEFYTRNRDRLAVRRARALVVDTYLLTAAAGDVVERAIEARIPVFVCVTSDSTAQRFARLTLPGSALSVLCVAGSARAIESMLWVHDDDVDRHATRIAVLRDQSNAVRRETVSDICRTVRASFVACIHDLSVNILASSGDRLSIDLGDLKPFVKNQKGDGDALMAAVVDVFLSLAPAVGPRRAVEVLDLTNKDVVQRLKREVGVHIQRAISSYGATPGSVISFEEPFETWARLLDRQFKYSMMQVLNATTWLFIILAMDRLTLILVGEHVFRIPLKRALGFLGNLLKPLLGWLIGY